jgi:hypothetical protein
MDQYGSNWKKMLNFRNVEDLSIAIVKKLQTKLVEEATQALIELPHERKRICNTKVFFPCTINC